MSTRYVRTRYSIASSLASDYSRPFIDESWEKTFSLEETPFIPIEADTSGTTVTTSMLSSASLVALYNEDSANYVEVEWYYQRGTQADTVTFAQAATGDTITDDDAGGLYITNGARAGGYVRIANAATAGNNTTWLIRSAAASVITLVSEATVTADGADALNLYFMNRNLQRVTFGEMLVFGPVDPYMNLTITANTAAVSCRLFYAGT